jgi:tetratricopeptide (TPR) repeat protein
VPPQAIGLLLAALLNVQGPPPPLTAADAPLLSMLAVEGDSAPRVRARWLAGAARLPDPRIADLGSAYLDIFDYRYAQADTTLGRLLSDASPGDTVRGHVHLAIGESLLQRGDYSRARDALRGALMGPDSLRDGPARALALIRLASVVARLEGVPAQVALLERAGPLVPRSDAFLMATYLCARAGRTGEASAVDDAELGATLARQAGVRRLHANCRMLLAQRSHQQGSVANALTQFDEVQREQEVARDHAQRAATLQWMGYVHLTVGDYDVARQRLLASVAEGQQSGNLSAVGWAYVNLAAISGSMGDPQSALRYLDRAHTLFTEQGDPWGLAAIRSTQAEASLTLGLWSEAREGYGAALEAARAGRDRAGMVGNQVSLAHVAMGLGDLVAADSLLATADRSAVDLAMPGWRFSILAVEADLALRLGDVERAAKALTTYLQVDLTPVRRYRALARYAEVLAGLGSVTEAADTLDAALTQLDTWRATLDPAGLRRYAFQVQAFPVDPDLGVATLIADIARAGDTRKAFMLAERQKARTLLERLVRARAVRSGMPGEGKPVRDLVAMPLPADSVVARLPGGTALVAYVTGTGGEPTTAFLLQRSGTRAFILDPGDSLAADIARFVGNVRSPGVAAGLATRIGSRILSPVLASLDPGIHTLVFVPDGPLHRLPFGALRVADGTWLGARYQVAESPSAAMSLALADIPRGGAGRILALGDPTPPGDARWAMLPEALADDTRGLRPLPGAAREARRVARFSEGGQALTGGAATEAALRRGHSGFNVLHFATHAMAGGGSDDRTALLLTPGEGSDGLLGPGDLAALDLSGTQLVFLSACETGYGPLLRGEGLQGLTAPLLAAGVQTVVATAWRVDDATAGLVAERFYRGLADGLTAGEALRRAQEESAARGLPLSEWGAFVLLGNPGLTVPLRTPWSRGALLSGMLLSLAGLTTLFRTLRRVRVH